MGRPTIISREIPLKSEIKKVFPEVLTHFWRAYPREACCVIAGHSTGPKVFIAQNISENPEFYFEINPFIFVQIEDLGFQVFAVAHSHPNGEPLPSAADLEGWFFTDEHKKRTPRFPGVLYIITALTETQTNSVIYRSESGDLVEVDRLLAGETKSP